MNIEKIYTALKQDEMNSGLGIMVAEMEEQGYEVELMDIPIKSSELFEGKYEDMERLPDLIKITLFKSNEYEQTFAIEFVEYHEPVFKRYTKSEN